MIYTLVRHNENNVELGIIRLGSFSELYHLFAQGPWARQPQPRSSSIEMCGLTVSLLATSLECCQDFIIYVKILCKQ